MKEPDELSEGSRQEAPIQNESGNQTEENMQYEAMCRDESEAVQPNPETPCENAATAEDVEIPILNHTRRHWWE